MITREMVAKGLKTKVISLIMSPIGDGVVCKIGDTWFYFGGMTAEEYNSVETYKEEIPHDTIISEIYEALESFRTCPWSMFREEYQYYMQVLKEHGFEAA